MKEMDHESAINRRQFIAANSAMGALLLLGGFPLATTPSRAAQTDKTALQFSHFPNALYAFVWRNWDLVPLERMAHTVGATPEQLKAMASFMGLQEPLEVTTDQWERSYLTVIRRNWHLLPKEQLQTLMGWDETQLDFTLKEDDFFYIKLGSLKPDCPPIRFDQLAILDEKTKNDFQKLLKTCFPDGLPKERMPYFKFVKELSAPLTEQEKPRQTPQLSGFGPRIAYPYFALFGDPLLDPEIDSYPDAYLERLAASGVDNIWMHIVLSKLTPFPWDPSISTHWEKRLENLGALTERVRRHGIGIYLYLNEPRHQPESFFEKYPDLRGQGTALCTSHPAVQQYLEDSIALIVERVPLLSGFFSITASENPTNCWSHNQGAKCSRCGMLGATSVIAKLNNLYHRGIVRGYAKATEKLNFKNNVGPQLIVWDWGWQPGWEEGIISELPIDDTLLMSVSEWELEIERGGIKSTVGEYSVSSVGPGPRALRHWKIAKDHGLRTIAKIQANNSWEMGAVPYIPAVYNVAKHVENLRDEGVEGLMLSWTLGGYPSPNLEVVSLIGRDRNLSAEDAIKFVAERRFGRASSAIVRAWKEFSKAFSEFPFHINVVYRAPLQCAPANLLWPEPTQYKATMVGLPYDDVASWHGIYPQDTFTALLRRLSKSFNHIVCRIDSDCKGLKLTQDEKEIVELERNLIETVSIHYESVANQSDFILLRDALSLAISGREEIKIRLVGILNREIVLAKRMTLLQTRDSRLGYEASNHYFYTSMDLHEKILNCRNLLNNWI